MKLAQVLEFISRIREEDNCHVGRYPSLIFGGCRRDDECKVFAALCRLVEEAIELYKKDQKPSPPFTSGRDYANLLQDVV